MQRKNVSISSSFLHQRGFTLWEVLAAMVIMAISVLGVAAMQMMSLQANRGAFYRTQAVQIGAEILDAMRANPTVLNNYQGMTFDANTGSVANVPADPGCGTDSLGCNQADMASLDIRQWASHFVDVFGATDFRPTLPGGVGQIAANGDVYSVTITWNQQGFQSDGNGNAVRAALTDNIMLQSGITP